MKRREFITLLGGAAVSMPFGAQAQRVSGMPKVGVLMAGAESAPDNQKRIAAFRQGFAELGWKDGDNVRIEYRWSAGKAELIAQYAKELVAMTPDVILANSTSVIEAFHNLKPSMPVVFALSMDPVGLGHVKSLARPGGNFTGFTFIDPELIGKWMALLKDVSPAVTRASVLFNPATLPTYDKFAREVAAIRQPGAIEIATLPVGSTGEMETAIKTLAGKPGNGLIVGPDPFNQVRIEQIAQLTSQHKLPAISVYRPFVQAGGLMAYGPDTADIFRRTAGYVDRVLKGARPEDLPVQQPTKFELIINLKTAKTLGLEVPPKLLFTADEVIE
jgi:putative ABC transport system substrate-binding protein